MIYFLIYYFVKNKELVLGPFQGPIACTRIPIGKGVCGVAWQKNEIIMVDDVNAFTGHISCNAASKSEIVLPVTNSTQEVSLVLDIDSDQYHHFDAIDKQYLTEVTNLIKTLL